MRIYKNCPIKESRHLMVKYMAKLGYAADEYRVIKLGDSVYTAALIGLIPNPTEIDMVTKEERLQKYAQAVVEEILNGKTEKN